ncbi:MAG: hypothetical protein K2F80_00595, partial [Muribaculaceae bacterium]|nr:hypothetical protein [Muribaculaceae bacterium]
MLRKITTLLTIAMAACTLTGHAEEAKKESPKQYIKATDLRIINKGFDDTERVYSRIPVWLKDSVR